MAILKEKEPPLFQSIIFWLSMLVVGGVDSAKWCALEKSNAGLEFDDFGDQFHKFQTII